VVDKLSPLDDDPALSDVTTFVSLRFLWVLDFFSCVSIPRDSPFLSFQAPLPQDLLCGHGFSGFFLRLVCPSFLRLADPLLGDIVNPKLSFVPDDGRLYTPTARRARAYIGLS